MSQESKIIASTGNYRLVEITIIDTPSVAPGAEVPKVEPKIYHIWEHHEGKDSMGGDRWRKVPDGSNRLIVQEFTRLLIGGKLKFVTIFALVFILSGCLSADVRAGNQANQQHTNQGPVTIQEPIPFSPPQGEKLADDGAGPWFVKPIKEELAASSNATQQSLTGLGLQVSKIGENVTGLRSDVALQASATANAIAEIKTTIALDAKVEAIATATANIETKLNAKLEAIAQAQVSAIAGLGNRIENRNESIKAGGNVSQFTPEMKEVILNAQNETSFNLKILGGIMVALGLGTVYHNRQTHKASIKRIEVSEAHTAKLLKDHRENETKRLRAV